MSFNNLNYAAMTPCEREGIMGNCGINCRVYRTDIDSCLYKEEMEEEYKYELIEEMRKEKLSKL